MRDGDGDRFGAVVGIVVVVVYVVGIALTGSPPKPTSSNAQVHAYILDKRTAILTQMWLFCLATGLFVWFVSALRSVLRRAEADTGHLANVFFGASVVGAGILTAGFITYAGFVYKAAATASGDLTRFAFDVGALAPAFAGFALSVAAVVFAVLVLSTGVLGKWTAWLALVAVVTQLIGTFGVFAKTGAFSLEGVFGFVPFAFIMLWLLGTSVAMLRAVSPVAPVAA